MKEHESMTRLGFLGCLFLFSACGFSPKLDPVASPLSVDVPRGADAALAELSGRAISEFTVLIFPDSLSRAEWEAVFRLTQELSALRKRTLNDSARAAEVLLTLYEKYSVYFLNWGDAENCTLQEAEIRCSPLYDVFGENPLNGGLPEIVGPLRVARTDDGKNPLITFGVKKDASNYGNFTLQLKLRPELDAREIYLKGEAVVEEGSRFLRDGQVRAHYRWGYAEIRFSRPESDAAQ